MNAGSIFFYFAVMAVFLAEAAILCRMLPLQRRLTEEDRANKRFAGLDGLRGLLAPSVFVHHAVLYLSFLHIGNWFGLTSIFYSQMGVLPVTLFFFLTGYLFWSKLMKHAKLNFSSFIKNRVGRLGGAYLLACVLLFAFAMVQSGFHRQVSWGRLMLEALAWLSFLGAGHDVNQVFDSKRMLGQIWTLRLEWMFYLSLPCLGWFARKKTRLPMLLVVAALSSVLIERVTLDFSAPLNYLWKMVGYYAHMLILTFSVGMVIAIIPKSGAMRTWAQGWVATLLSAVLLGITACFVTPHHGWLESVMLAFPFACVCFGNTWFGLLSLTSVRSLGRVSYSFFLLHMFVLYAGQAVLSRFTAMGSLATWGYWSFTAVCGIVTVVLSYLSYQFLEYPFLKKPLVADGRVTPEKKPAAFLRDPPVIVVPIPSMSEGGATG